MFSAHVMHVADIMLSYVFVYTCHVSSCHVWLMPGSYFWHSQSMAGLFFIGCSIALRWCDLFSRPSGQCRVWNCANDMGFLTDGVLAVVVGSGSSTVFCSWGLIWQARGDGCCCRTGWGISHNSAIWPGRLIRKPSKIIWVGSPTCGILT